MNDGYGSDVKLPHTNTLPSLLLRLPLAVFMSLFSADLKQISSATQTNGFLHIMYDSQVTIAMPTHSLSRAGSSSSDGAPAGIIKPTARALAASPDTHDCRKTTASVFSTTSSTSVSPSDLSNSPVEDCPSATSALTSAFKALRPFSASPAGCFSPRTLSCGSPRSFVGYTTSKPAAAASTTHQAQPVAATLDTVPVPAATAVPEWELTAVTEGEAARLASTTTPVPAAGAEAIPWPSVTSSRGATSSVGRSPADAHSGLFEPLPVRRTPTAAAATFRAGAASQPGTADARNARTSTSLAAAEKSAASTA